MHDLKEPYPPAQDHSNSLDANSFLAKLPPTIPSQCSTPPPPSQPLQSPRAPPAHAPGPAAATAAAAAARALCATARPRRRPTPPASRSMPRGRGLLSPCPALPCPACRPQLTKPTTQCWLTAAAAPCLPPTRGRGSCPEAPGYPHSAGAPSCPVERRPPRPRALRKRGLPTPQEPPAGLRWRHQPSVALPTPSSHLGPSGLLGLRSHAPAPALSCPPLAAWPLARATAPAQLFELEQMLRSQDGGSGQETSRARRWLRMRTLPGRGRRPAATVCTPQLPNAPRPCRDATYCACPFLHHLQHRTPCPRAHWRLNQCSAARHC